MAKGKPKAIDPAPLEDRTPGALLREARIRHQLSQKQLAERVGRSVSEIFRMLVALERRGYVTRDPASSTASTRYRILVARTSVPAAQRAARAFNP